jgi:acyl-CoA synthetase (AMP-forming)/AMP-acid ligase II
LEPGLRLMQDYAVTHLPLVPPLVLALSQHPAVEEFDLSRLRLIAYGAAPMAKEIARRCAERLGCAIGEIYGLSEMSGTGHVAPVARGPDWRLGGLRLEPNLEAKIVDVATGEELGPNQPGELWLRGSAMMRGYLNQPEATRQAITADGWLRTGDVALADADGNFTIVDRMKELIKYKAYQVAPAELEAVLLAHPAVADAAVVPSADEAAGEVPKAFVVLRGEAGSEELIAFVAARVAPFKKVRRVEFVDQIPKSPSGKILRRVLVERERAALTVSA